MAEKSDARYLSTAEVASRLEIKPATVYAYVSRGLLTKLPAADRRGSLFREDEVARLARGRRRGTGHRSTIDDVTTAISAIDDDRLYYRDHDVAELVAVHSAESVAGLLWTGEAVPQEFAAPAPMLATVRAAVDALDPGVRSTDRMRVAVTVASASDPLRFDLSTPGVLRTARILLAVEAAGLGAAQHDSGTLAERIAPILTEEPVPAELLDTALTLLAEHGLAVSTVAARVAASARVHPYAVVSAGLGALDSQYHGTASTLAYRFLSEAIGDPLGAASERLRLGGGLPGFGHLVYRSTDPRAEILLEKLRAVPAAAPAFAAVDTIADQLGAPHAAVANIDLALAVLMHAYRMRPDAGETLFALARTIGWVAHTLEEYTEPPLRFRPTRRGGAYAETGSIATT
ncbi:excisionase [Nocardia brasiliensis]|uniref:citrate synthase (unknown stereospecificity) n=1 Tax=Nocardia brasiliensis TaxID=37326 RepID=A0A6G9XST6_NOCBR|nr:citrate synthase [Nocardia brasiliensis]QIS03968.1 excisionase [Nocardia brasiliensis]